MIVINSYDFIEKKIKKAKKGLYVIFSDLLGQTPYINHVSIHTKKEPYFTSNDP